jgi:UDP-N-acetylmuramoyl-tripeptide--D-alanyl-D-alanine ligase
MSAALWTAADAAAAVSGTISGAWTASGVATDSRAVIEGDLFVALKGEQMDGHDFVAGALMRGAAAAMVSHVPAGLTPERLLLVGDTLAGLQALGRAARERAHARRIAVTGSVGKTGTKEALRHVLSAQAPTHASVASYNNHVGVPLTLARMPRDAVYAVFEIGMNHPGEIAPLAHQVAPEVAIVTTVEAAHTEFFPGKGIVGVAEEKAEIFAAGARVAVINRDTPHFDLVAAKARGYGVARVVGFGAHALADVRLVDLELAAEHVDVTASVYGLPIHYRIGTPGRHWAMNSLAVLAAADAVGADLAQAAATFATLKAPKGRGQRHRIGTPGFTLIDDSYNANPTSMRAAFAVLATARPEAGGRRIAVLGDMRELGPEADALHAALAPDLLAANVELVFTCGPHMAQLFAALPRARRGGHAASSDALVPLVRGGVHAGDVVLVKGSLGSRMAPIVEALLAMGGPAPAAQRSS